VRVIYGLADKLLASQEGSFSIELANEVKDGVARICSTHGETWRKETEWKRKVILYF
jgi:hypothetical protein